MGRLSPKGDRPDREAGHRARPSIAPAPSSAPSPLAFSRGTRTKAQPARHDKRAAERWLKERTTSLRDDALARKPPLMESDRSRPRARFVGPVLAGPRRTSLRDGHGAPQRRLHRVL